MDTFNPPLLARMVVARKGALPRALQMEGPLAGRSRSPDYSTVLLPPIGEDDAGLGSTAPASRRKKREPKRVRRPKGRRGRSRSPDLRQRRFCPQLAKRDSGLGSTAPASWRKKGEPKRVRRPEGRRTIYGRGVVLPARRVRGRTLASRLVLSVVAGEGKALRLLLWGPTLAVVGGRGTALSPLN